MNLVESLLDVLALIGIILTGGFLVFFLGDLLLSVLDPSYGSIFKRKKQQKAAEDEKPVVKAAEPVVEHVEQKQPQTNVQVNVAVNEYEDEDKVKLNDFDNLNDYNDAEALKEQQMLEGAEAFSRDDAMAELKAEEERFKQEQLAQALARQKAVEQEPVEDKEDEEEFDLDSLFVEDDDEDLSEFNFEEEQQEEAAEESIEEPIEELPVEEVAVEEVAVEEVAEEPVEEEQEEVAEEKEEQPSQETLALLAEIEKLKQDLEAAKALAEKPVEIEVKTIVNNMTKEECEEKLEALKARLKANEKEFKQAKKEYIPLRKIMKTLDSDKKKLRRKEAIVAKQKVVLYGVNNVVDIDPEKAQKLAEDLDLLDGLRLSVQHCQEVIKTNEERIPLLERNYEILLAENTNIKADIANLEEMLKSFETSSDDNNSEDATENN